MAVDKMARLSDITGEYNYYSTSLCVLVVRHVEVPAGVIAHEVDAEINIRSPTPAWLSVRAEKASLGVRLSCAPVRIMPNRPTRLKFLCDNLTCKTVNLWRGDRLVRLGFECNGSAMKIMLR